MADTRIKSVFGAYADKLQVMIDSRSDNFAPLWFPKYFGWGSPQIALTYISAIGRSRVEAAASVVNRDSPAPIGARNRFEKLSGEVASIKKKYKMTEDDYRNFMTIQGMNVSDATKRTQLLNLLWADTKRAGDAPLKQLDRMVLEGLSTGSITVTVANNADGIVTDTIDLLMPSANKVFTSYVWGTPATALPMTDVMNRVKAAAALGTTFSKILMDLATFWQFSAAAETTAMLAGYFRMGTNQKRVGTLDEVNQMLLANNFPVIEIVNESIGLEKDGVITATNPFVTGRAVFIPAGNLGEIKNALAIEEMRPVEGIVYAKNQNVLISKWAENDPFGEWTKGEINAFPAIEAIDSIHILNTAATS